MARPLHLIDPLSSAGDEGMCVVRALIDEGHAREDDVLMLGGARETSRANAVRTRSEVARPGAPRRAVMARVEAHEGRVVCWSIGALRVVGRAHMARTTLVLSTGPVRGIGAPERRAARALVGSVRIVAWDGAVVDAWGEALGLELRACDVDAPGLGANGVQRAIARRDEVRWRWGVDDGSSVICDLGGPRDRELASRVAYHVGVAVMAGRDVRGVVSPQAMGLGEARAFLEGHGIGQSLILDDGPREDRLAGSDVGVMFADRWSRRAGARRALRHAWGGRAGRCLGLATIAEGEEDGESVTRVAAMDRMAISRAIDAQMGEGRCEAAAGDDALAGLASALADPS